MIWGRLPILARMSENGRDREFEEALLTVADVAPSFCARPDAGQSTIKTGRRRKPILAIVDQTSKQHEPRAVPDRFRPLPISPQYTAITTSETSAPARCRRIA